MQELEAAGSQWGLWAHREFVRLWSAQAISQLGTQVSMLAIPTLAILNLGASPAEVGVLRALPFIPVLLLSLGAGVLADRVRRKRILVVCDLGRAAALALLTLLYLVGRLDLLSTYIIVLATGSFTAVFEVAYQSYLPHLVNRAQLIEGNAKLQMTRSVALVAGPALAGLLIQAFGAARAVLADALSFLASAALIRMMSAAETHEKTSEPSGLGADLRGAFVVLFHDPIQLRVIGAVAQLNLSAGMNLALFLLLAYEVLHLSPVTVGFIYGAGSVAAVLGSYSASFVSKRAGLGPTFIASVFITALGPVFLALAHVGYAILMLVIFGVLVQWGSAVGNITQLTIRQSLTDQRMQGRIGSIAFMLGTVTLAIGSLLGGFAGNQFGVVGAIYVLAIAALASPIWVANRRIWRLA